MTETRNRYVVPLTFDDRGSVDLPVLPGPQFWLEIRDGDGNPLSFALLPLITRSFINVSKDDKTPLGKFLRGLKALGKTKKKGKVKPAKRWRLAVRLSDFVAVDVLVKTREGKEPIAKAKVYAKLWSYVPAAMIPLVHQLAMTSSNNKRVAWRYLGETNADGKLRAMVPKGGMGVLSRRTAHWSPLHPTFRIDAVGMASALIQLDGVFGPGWYTNNKETAAEFAKNKAHRLRTAWLDAGTSVRGRLMLDAKRPAAGVVVFYQSVYRLAKADAKKYYNGDVSASKVVRTDANGRFEIRGFSAGFPYMLSMGLDSELLGKLELRSADTLQPNSRVLLRWGRLTDHGSRLGDIRIDQLNRVTIHINSHSGGPARYSRLTLVPSLQSKYQGDYSYVAGYEQDLLYRLAAQRPLANRRGRIVLLLPNHDYDVFVLGRENEFLVDQWKWKVLVTGRRMAKEIQLRAMPLAEGIVFDRDGDPLPGATLRSGDGFSSVNRRLRCFLKAANEECMQATSDTEGKFRIPYIPAKSGMIYVWVTASPSQLSHIQRIPAGSVGQTELVLRTRFPKRVRKQGPERGKKD